MDLFNNLSVLDFFSLYAAFDDVCTTISSLYGNDYDKLCKLNSMSFLDIIKSLHSEDERRKNERN